MSSLRSAFASTLIELGQEDKDLVVIVGDISHGLLKDFRQSFPKRYFNIGICEPATVNVAAGLSYVGLTPVVHTIAPFLIERSFEQIKLDFGYQKLAGNFVSVGSSFDYSKLGCSHHSYADVSLISHLANSQIFMPASELEFNILFRATYKSNHINYFRLTENPHGVLIDAEEIVPGKAIRIQEGSDVTLITIGPQLRNCVDAAKSLSSVGISVEIIYLPTFKPFDNKSVYASVAKTGAFITVEELSAQDGLYNAVLRSVLGLASVKGTQLAVSDFIRSYGKYSDLQESAGLSVENIYSSAKRLLDKDFGL